MVTGTKSAFKNMKLEVKELEVDGVAYQPPTPPPSDAADISFTSSEGLAATDVAAALDELKALIDGLA